MVAKIALLAIVGPTASGKTGLSINIAKKFNGEVISADSRAVYKGLDIGTAKPSLEERAGIKHYGFDLIGPGETFTVADFKQYAKKAINDIKSRGKLPILVGGSGLYIDSILYDFSLGPVNTELRQTLEKLNIEQLQTQINIQGLEMPENYKNKRYLVRTLEKGCHKPAKKDLLKGAEIIGLDPGIDVLRENITTRANQMIEQGVLDEVDRALKAYDSDSEALTGGIYRVFKDVINGKQGIEEGRIEFIKSDLKLVKKQMTWFKRNKDIKWFKLTDDAFNWFSHAYEVN
jgi:tRNA dimethylallyltransferase